MVQSGKVIGAGIPAKKSELSARSVYIKRRLELVRAGSEPHRNKTTDGRGTSGC